MLGPLLFILYINDIDEAAIVLEILKKFADDTKGAKMVQTEEDAKVLQDCLDRLIKWGEEWSMEFNVKKCKIMHFGRSNIKFKYTMNGVELAVVESERDIGV